MRILSLLILAALLFSSSRPPDSPHGAGFKLTCTICHSTDGWQLDKKNYSFDHNTTKMPLKGQHKELSCRQCHPSLVFPEAKTECNQCHTDIHQATTGSDCSRCHTPSSWLVNNVNEIHRLGRFPLLGAHRTTDCAQCHKSESLVRFDVPGINCVDCHLPAYIATTNPNHSQTGLSEDCVYCHPVNSFQWAGPGFNHNFFPLAQGHATPGCSDCHPNTVSGYSGLSKECNSCHQKDYLTAKVPDHIKSNFPTSCETCHSLRIGWKPANFSEHNSKFQISSGSHGDLFCADCHENSSDYTLFNCLNCHAHNKSDMDNRHKRRSNYTYESAACYRCHHH